MTKTIAIRLLILNILIILNSFNSQAQQLWQPLEKNLYIENIEILSNSSSSRFYALNKELFKTRYFNLPLDAHAVIHLPNPDGNEITLRIKETPIMQSGLASKYPHIKTFTAYAPENKALTAKIDYTDKGFHAMVFDGENTYFINPHINEEELVYVVFYKRDAIQKDNYIMSCEFDQLKKDPQDKLTNGEEIYPNKLNTIQRPQLLEYGLERKTYRIAIACTGEYAKAVDGANPNISGVLSAMITTLNRVNGIYEREFAATMMMIDNNDTLIFLESNSDPYNNNSSTALLSQNQNVVNSRIGTENYDIGHVFSTGGGGVAIYASICRHNQKARGVTGNSNPVGDPFDVDYVAHEIGHQFGGNHTFNRCGGTGQGEPDYAFEPGSGSTILAYAGICGQNNLQGNSDAYFHHISLNEITQNISGNFEDGVGGTCGAIDTGFIAPIIPPIQNEYTIPSRTPFILTAPASGNPNDTVYYSWEQANNGNYNQNESQGALFTHGPSLRSYFPKESPVRIIPQYDSLLNGKYNIVGERLPNVERTLSFKLIVRQYDEGWGSFRISDDMLLVHTIEKGEGFRVTQPSKQTEKTWISNTLDTVIWRVAGSDAAPINCQYVDVFLSSDGGYTFKDTLSLGIPNNGEALVQIPNIVTDSARIMVKCSNNIFFDISSNNFKIAKTNNIDAPYWNNDIQVYPNPAKDAVHIINNNIEENYKIVVRNLLGQIVWKGDLQKKETININNWTKGMYQIQLTSTKTGHRYSVKITVN